MTEDPSSIPPQHRNQVTRRSLQSASEPAIQAVPPEPLAGAKTDKAPTGRRRFEVPYQGFEGMARRIIVPVTFNDSVTANLLIDTGAPYLLISPKLAERLGLIKDEDGGLIVMTGGIGGSVPAMLAVVDSISIGEARAEFLPATITPSISGDFEGLVGMDFLADYRISIDSNRSVITFDELPAQKDRPGGHDEIWWRSNFQHITHLRSEWSRYLASLESVNMAGSETETLKRIARNQHEEADKLHRKLERFASDHAVPNSWRR